MPPHGGARYVIRCTKLRLQQITLALREVSFPPKLENLSTSATASAWQSAMPFFFYMGNNSNKGGRPPKIEATAFRCSVNFSAREHAALQTMFERSGAYSMSSFIKNFLFQKPFKVFTVDENTRIFIDALASLNAHYRSIGVSYDLLVKTLRENFTEKKAIAAIEALEKKTMKLVSISQDIVDLARKFDEQWSQKSR